MAIYLDGNFDFLENATFESKNQVIEIVCKIVKFMREKHYEELAVNSRKIVEIIINEIFENQGLPLKKYLKDNISYLKAQGYKKYNIQFIQRMYNIAFYGNEGAHKTHSVRHNDALIIINELYNFLNEYMGNENIEECDLGMYFPEDGICKSVIANEPQSNYLKDDMSITKRNIDSWLTLEDAYIMIPLYQRGYSWTEENVEQLLQDISKRSEDGQDHFFGTIAAKEIREVNNDRVIKIIDGQQRLTTSLLLACAARDELLLNNVPEKDIFPKIFKNKISIEKFFKNPTAENKGNTCFKQILTGDLRNENSSYKNETVYKNYWYIRNWFKDKKYQPNDIFQFVNVYTTHFQVSVISFNEKYYNQKIEMSIFENLNSKGKSLCLYDLVKNHIFNLCEESVYNDEESSKSMTIEYNHKVGNIIDEFAKDDNAKANFFLSLCHYGTGEENKRGNISITFENIKKAIYKFFDVDKEDGITKKEYLDFLENLSRWVTVYYGLVKDKGNGIFFDNYLGVSAIINIVKESKKFELFLPVSFLLLEVLNFNNASKTYKLSSSDKDIIKKIYTKVLNFIIKTSVITGQGDSDIKRYMYTSIFSIRKIVFDDKEDVSKTIRIILDELSNRLENNDTRWTFEEFKKGLRLDLSNNIAYSLLQYIEYTILDSASTKEYHNRLNPSLEHIMPQDGKEWMQEAKKLDPNFDSTEWITNHSNHVLKLGNMMILSGPNNSKARNNVFLTKKVKCYEKLTSPLYKNEDDKIDVSRKTKWTFEDIDRRTDVLVEYICAHVITR